jgi:hypothetical protein
MKKNERTRFHFRLRPKRKTNALVSDPDCRLVSTSLRPAHLDSRRSSGKQPTAALKYSHPRPAHLHSAHAKTLPFRKDGEGIEKNCRRKSGMLRKKSVYLHPLSPHAAPQRLEQGTNRHIQ